MHDIDLSVIIPTYREEENLRIILPRLQQTLSRMKIRFEISVIDTCESLDQTRQVCLDNGATYINREHGNTYGDAVRTGVQHAQGQFTVFMDADGSHTPEFIPQLYRERASCDVVVASRYVEGGSSDNSGSLIFMSLLVNKMYAWFLGIRCKDVSNSFKLYRTEQLKTITLKSNNFDIVEEILVKLDRIRKPLTIKELPYSFKERMFGHTKRNLVSFALSFATTLIKLKLMK
ncbi:hypothetical protein AUK40_04860 [Candidatus Wirthbacteria bacterium CG2_30_54_11]|uniref:Glycosyltransferase 2-like domain-containing protein n=1 Tax=Candidatus Wirthbacteria bacterium CG2_30_54_11 TaxID=1817892 RepID=A0A1J5ITK4_9BACT|nr:MAG: hypothetical protein AUK40_04860 [Candidatus Wirthbacteria bacterium CG2_30_54_11]